MSLHKLPLFFLPILLLVLVSPLLGQPRATFPRDGVLITGVNITGTERVTPATIAGVMSLREGSRFTREAWRRDMESIIGLGTLDPLETRILWEEAGEGEITLTVVAKENPVVASITIVGNVRVSEDALRAQLDYREGQISPTILETSTRRNIQNFYRDQGFRRVRVHVKVSPAVTEGEIDVLITVEEGERIRIRRVHLRGNDQFNDFIMKQQLINSPGLLFFSNYFDEMALEDDLAIIRQKYRDEGFLDVLVRLGEVDYDQERKDVSLEFIIDSGPRYRVGETRAEGVTYFTEEELREILIRLEDRHFSGRRLTRALDRVNRLYGDQGYVDTQVDYRLEKEIETGLVSVILEVEESEVVYVGSITIDMEDYQYDLTAFDKFVDWLAPPTRVETVEREIRLKPGEKYRTSDEVRTQERLRNLGIFRRVDVVRREPARPSPGRREKDAIIVVEEDPAAAWLAIIAGVGELSGPAVTLQVSQPNWGGRADRASASATVGQRNQAFRLRFFKRYLGESENSLDTSLYWSQDRFRAYRQRTVGGSTELGTPVNEYTSAFFRARIERVGYSRYDRSTQTDMSPYWTFAGRALLVNDHRDNVRWPTRGHLISGGVEAGVARNPFVKLLHTYEWYQELGRTEAIYAYEHTVGIMPHEMDRVGLSERFFIGGTQSLRGFRIREVGPRDRGNRDLAIGGATRITQRHELRYPFNDFLKGRVFADAGILERGIFQVGKPRASLGVGLILDFGPVLVEVDFARAVMKQRLDETQFFHLRLSSGF
ncbi:MAG: BamA/TamA family outer membrane protein [Candidatus Sumerlaeia bacterium]|nr:BamA/TamA family outer membrane protein [Candidatus Sumerlaeia bacterium]